MTTSRLARTGMEKPPTEHSTAAPILSIWLKGKKLLMREMKSFPSIACMVLTSFIQRLYTAMISSPKKALSALLRCTYRPKPKVPWPTVKAVLPRTVTSSLCPPISTQYQLPSIAMCDSYLSS